MRSNQLPDMQSGSAIIAEQSNVNSETEYNDRVCELIVECGNDAGREDLVQQYGKIKYRLPLINSYVIEIPEKHVQKLAGSSGIKGYHQTAQITAQMINARKTVCAATTPPLRLNGSGVGIAILDTGVAPVNDFIKPVNRITAFKDFINYKDTPYDDNGHGTHVAGIACGNGYNSSGMYSGIAPCANIIAVKILDDTGQGSSTSVLAGLQWVIDNMERLNIRVANLSIGTTDDERHDPLIKAVNAAWDKGLVITVAAGNNGPSPRSITSPGISRKVITVGASDDGI